MTTNERKTTQPAIEGLLLLTPTGVPYGIRLNFSNGEALQITEGQLDSDIRSHALIHGLKQKLVDAAAISRDPETGRAATIDAKFAAVREVHARLLAGSWNKPRDSEGSAGSGGLLFRALSKMYEGKKTPEAIREYLESKTDAEKSALRKNPRVAAIIAELRVVAAPGTDNSNDLLGELEA